MKLTEVEKLKYAFAATMSEVAEQIPARLTRVVIGQLKFSILHIQEVGATLHAYLDDNHLVLPFAGVARFYEEQSAFHEAQQSLTQGFRVAEKRFGETHPKVAVLLSNLAQIHLRQGLYVEAEPLLVKVLKIDRSFYGNLHLEVAVDLNNLGELYRNQGYYEFAESLYIQAISIQKILKVTNTIDFATSLNNLALTYYSGSQQC